MSKMILSIGLEEVQNLAEIRANNEARSIISTQDWLSAFFTTYRGDEFRKKLGVSKAGLRKAIEETYKEGWG